MAIDRYHSTYDSWEPSNWALLGQASGVTKVHLWPAANLCRLCGVSDAPLPAWKLSKVCVPELLGVPRMPDQKPANQWHFEPERVLPQRSWKYVSGMSLPWSRCCRCKLAQCCRHSSPTCKTLGFRGKLFKRKGRNGKKH